MNKRILVKLLLGSILLTVCALITRTYAGEDVRNSKTKGLEKTMGNDLYRSFDINNIFNWYSNTGDGSYNYITQQSGFFFPKGSSKTATFEDGLVWGGFHKGRSDPSVGGSTYWRGLQAGAILTPGTATTDPVPDNPDLAKYRIYVVRPDVNPNTPYPSVQAKMEAEAALINTWQTIISPQDLYNQYIQDWNEWPAKDGAPAPYKDVNGDGRYDPAVDIPGQAGADQTLYYVANDVSPTRTTAFYGSPPIGIEMHRTIWGYNLTGALGNTIFESSLIINKSGAPLDSAYLVEWADVDLGDAGDDYAGCDIDRNLGYTYNGKPYDATYGYQVPATGYTFFQGPIVQTGNPADVAVFRLHYRPGYKNLKMTTFVFFINSNQTYSDPVHGTGGDIQWYRLMNGLISSSGSPFIDPTTNSPTKFTLSGDPVAGTGWIDGTHGLIPGDRRQCQVTGPFTLANGDTQEVVVAHLIGLGSDRISSVAVLKWYSDLAQTAYNNLFNIAFPPPTPKVEAVALDKQVVLDWSGAGIENFSSVGYNFEGYNVYQFKTSTPDITNAVRLATYDLVDAITTIFDDVYDASTGYVLKKPVEFGTDSGLKREYETTTDAVNSQPFRNGTPYYFGVSSYSFNSTGVPTHLESAPDLLTVVPQSSPTGVRYQQKFGDTLTVTHAAGKSDGWVYPIVVNPTKLTGNTYEVHFDTAGAWKLLDKTTGATLLANQTDQNADDVSPIVDGMQIRVIGAPIGVKNFLHVAGASGKITPPTFAAFAFNSDGFPTLDGQPANGVNDRPSNDWGGGLWGIHTNPSGDYSYAYFLSRVFRNDNFSRFSPYDFEIRFTPAGGKAYLAFTDGKIIDVPFEIWNIGIGTPDDPSDDYQMIPWVNDGDGNDEFNLEQADHTISGGDNDPYTDWIYWYSPVDKTPGSSGYLNEFANFPNYDGDPNSGANTGAHKEVMARMVLVNWNGGSVSDPTWPANVDQLMPPPGTVIRITSTKPNAATDAFSFTAPAPTTTTAATDADVQKINVFPNPYIGFNPLETDKYNRFVTFSHLPTKATIRIFNLAGVLVRTLQKNSTDQFFQWDLKNESGFPVAAGMYIVYIDMPDLGTTKVLKLGVIPEQQYIDRW
jgi:hypothetical protein